MATAAAPLNTPSVPDHGRPDSIEDASNRFFIHPISDRIVKLAIAARISANAVSLIGLGCGFLAAILFWFQPKPPFVLGAFFAMICWHVFDGADGKLARATGTASAFGRFVDGACDHLVFTAIYISLSLHLMATGYSAWIWVLAFAAAWSHAFQAAGYEERRHKFQRRWAGIHRTSIEPGWTNFNGRQSFWATLYNNVQKLAAGPDHGLDEALAELQKTPGHQQLVAKILDRTKPTVRAWGILNANNRTLLITIFAFLGKPLLYFLFELTIFNIVMIILIIVESRQDKRLIELAHNAGNEQP